MGLQPPTRTLRHFSISYPAIAHAHITLNKQETKRKMHKTIPHLNKLHALMKNIEKMFEDIRLHVTRS